MPSPLSRFFQQHASALPEPHQLSYHLPAWVRFDLQGVLAPDDTGYFAQVLHRASTLFEAAFEPTDEVLLVYQEPCFKRRRIRSSNYLFRQLGIKKHGATFRKSLIPANPNAYHEGRWVQLFFSTTAAHIPHRKLLAAVSRHDFPATGVATLAGLLYFFNQTRGLIFYMYDDWGLVISSSNLATTWPFYHEYNHWILDYDRAIIDALFAAGT